MQTRMLTSKRGSINVVLRALQVESAGLEMSVLDDVVSVALVRDLITWSASDAILSKLTSPDQGVYLCGKNNY